MKYAQLPTMRSKHLQGAQVIMTIGSVMRNRADSFGGRLSFRRRAMNLSQRALGAASGVGHATIQTLEQGKGMPSIKTVESLATALHISPGWLGFREGQGQAHSMDVAADFDPLAVIAQVQEAIANKRPIEQSAKYLDQRGVRCWLDLVRDQALSVDKMPFPAIAQEIAALSLGRPIDLVGLGCGTAHQEIKLAGLLNGLQLPVRLGLIDISVYLLIAGYQQARQALKDTAIDINALIGDIYNFPKYAEQLIASPVEHLRLFCLFGYTFGNLRQEDDLFNRVLSAPASRSGDLLLLDITLARPEPDAEPVLRHERSPEFLSLMYGFVAAPVHSIIGASNRVEVEPKLEPGRLPGSYVINLYGRYSLGGVEQLQSLAIVTRYQLDSLATYLASKGWRVVGQYGYEGTAKSIVVCQKT